uniref:DUF3575 domain-containing protein n=1 Tax=Flavobacterium sp. TaxID=239 RepID=UPI004049E275
MKNKCILLIAFAFGIFSAKAQFNSDTEHEIKVNIFNLLAIASVEVGYEHFLDDNQSLEGEIHINDRFSYHTEKNSREFKTNSIKVGYNYYFGQDKAGSGFYANPFVKYRFGDFEQEIEGVLYTLDMNTFIAGLGVGYKINAGDKFTIAPYASIARGFNEDVNDRFSGIELNGGISIGVRF